ncbi:hypothetical protein HYFRA_00013483 [Hymenoscyphus fraxineus]|uniref:Hydrophobin n=1 Tax=Hymenoscyphus fraxineus TaxID=746836 RepID=A0A9N9L7W5_9HELO|nr:hypothetical protein HYFRA_00013483 [Hymenoscyphus fraxineus]
MQVSTILIAITPFITAVYGQDSGFCKPGAVAIPGDASKKCGNRQAFCCANSIDKGNAEFSVAKTCEGLVRDKAGKIILCGSGNPTGTFVCC